MAAGRPVSFLQTLPYSPFLEWIEANRNQTFFCGLFRLAKDLAQLSASHPSAGSSSRHEHRGRKVGSSSPVLFVPVQALLLTRNTFWTNSQILGVVSGRGHQTVFVLLALSAHLPLPRPTGPVRLVHARVGHHHLSPLGRPWGRRGEDQRLSC